MECPPRKEFREEVFERSYESLFGTFFGFGIGVASPVLILPFLSTVVLRKMRKIDN